MGISIVTLGVCHGRSLQVEFQIAPLEISFTIFGKRCLHKRMEATTFARILGKRRCYIVTIAR